MSTCLRIWQVEGVTWHPLGYVLGLFNNYLTTSLRIYLATLIARCYYPYMHMTMYLVGTLKLLGYMVKDCMYLVT
jgi:hypothetical protein